MRTKDMKIALTGMSLLLAAASATAQKYEADNCQQLGTENVAWLVKTDSIKTPTWLIGDLKWLTGSSTSQVGAGLVVQECTTLGLLTKQSTNANIAYIQTDGSIKTETDLQKEADELASRETFVYEKASVHQMPYPPYVD
jgi:hypothetical protein